MRALRAFAVLFGASCVLIGLAHILFGPSVIVGSIPGNATMDSEDRFFGTLFAGFGAANIWAAMDIPQRRPFLLALMLVFFVGGLARILSWIAVGRPHDLFVLLGSLELLIPLLVWTWSGRMTRGLPH